MEIVFATNNQNKLEEVQSLLPKGIKLLRLSDIGCYEEIPETQPTIEGNAQQKAFYIKEKYGYNCFADDTGLEVTALNGAPGVYSARYAGPEKNNENNINKLLKQLINHNDRSAQFKTVIGLYLNGTYHEFTGICEGTITLQRFGSKGFGYDSVFIAKGYNQTFAQMDSIQKNKISHRGKAINLLLQFLSKL